MSQPTPKQVEYLRFIARYTSRHRYPPSFADMERHFMVTAPSVSIMIKTLEAKGFISRVAGAPRSLRVLVQVPDVESKPAARGSQGRRTDKDERDLTVRAVQQFAQWWSHGCRALGAISRGGAPRGP